MKKRDCVDRFLAAITWFSGIATILIFAFLILFVLLKGLPHLKPSLFSLRYTSENVSLMPALISTILMTTIALLVSAPLGIFAAIYLTEYAKRRNKLVALIRIATETLAGIPSIVYGLFGLLFFVTYLGWGFSLIAGAVTLSMMILPLIIRSSEEAIIAIPETLREGAFGLGAGKLRVVFCVTLPSAKQGILAGIVLAIGRVIGETAALIYTSGTVAQVPTNPMMSARTLSVHLYALSSEGMHVDEGYATAVVLIAMVILINMAVSRIARKIGGSK